VLHCLKYILVVTWLLCAVQPAPAQEFPGQPLALTQEDIEKMVDALKNELLKRHDAERHWEPKTLPEGNTRQESGRTALVCVALLDAGVPAQEDKLLAAINTLNATTINGSYARAVCLMVYSRLPDEFLELAGPDLQSLINSFNREEGGWSYYDKATRTSIDHSIVQLCILGLSDLADRGVRVPPGIFDAVRTRYLRLQGGEGGWGYKGPEKMTGSMTASGVATVALCNKHSPPNKQLKVITDRSISRGIKWLDTHFDAKQNPNDPYFTPYYWLFSAARAAQAVAIRSFGTHDWLCEGAASIATGLLAPNYDGSWRVKKGSNVDLAFALLYLSRGLKTVSFGVFVENDAAIDPIGLAPAAHAVNELIEQNTVWQRVSLADPLESWLRTPVVLVQGTTPPPWTNPENEPLSDPVAARLVKYAQHGGLVLFAPQRRGTNFVKAVKAWAERALPGRYWKAIRDDDPKTWHKKAAGIGPPTREWFMMLEGIDPIASMVTKGRRQTAAIEALLDCWQSITHGEPWSRRQTEYERPSAPKENKGTANLVLVRHDGEWNSEPLTADRAAKWLQAETGHDLWIQEATVEVLGDSAPKGDIAWVRGVRAEEAKAIDLKPFVAWIKDGGGLLIEQSSGRGAFATTFATTLAAELDALVVPSLRPASFPTAGAWPASVLALRKDGKTLAYVSTADCSLGMLAPRKINRDFAVEPRVTTAMLAELIPSNNKDD
jgi:hypothetical protein